MRTTSLRISQWSNCNGFRLKAEFVQNQQQNSEGYIYILFTFTFWFFSLSMLPYLTDRLFQWVVETEAGDGMFRSISEDWVFQCKFCFWIFYYVTNVLFIVPLGGGFCWCDGMTTQYMSDGANSALNLLQDFSIMAGWFQLISRVWNLKLKRSLTNLSKPCFKRWKNHVWQDSQVFEIRDETDKAQMKIPKLVLEPADASAAAR